MEWKKNVNTNLGITIILVFAALFTIIDFYVIGAYMDGYPFNDLNGNTSSSKINNNNPVVEDNNGAVEEKNVDEKSKDDLIFDCTFSEDYCLLLDEDNKKLEYYNWDLEGNWNPRLVVNGKAIELGSYRLNNYEFTDDNYLFVSCSSGTGNGRPAYFLIADLNGNVITTVDEKSLKSGLHNYYVSFENGEFVYDAVQEGSGVEYACNNMLEIDITYPIAIKSYDDVVYVKDIYQYVGNGRVSKINHIEKTFGDFMKDLTGYNSCQDAINNIDSWNLKGNDIRKFYGAK